MNNPTANHPASQHPTTNGALFASGETATHDDLFTRAPFHAPGYPYMPMSGRAAQFAPYKSLTGYEDLIAEKSTALASLGDRTFFDADSLE